MTSSMKLEVHNVSLPPEEGRVMAINNMHRIFGEDRMCSSENMIADRQTHTETLVTILRQGRLRHINDGANAPKKYGGRFLQELRGGVRKLGKSLNLLPTVVRF